MTDALRISDGNQTRAAALLGISQSTISRRMRHISKSKN
ncbi:helix-turn-helix domain-containing protein [Shewanella sp.]